MTSRKTVPHIKCQRCKHHHATHSILGAILLCGECFAKMFPNLAMQSLFMEDTPTVSLLKEDK